MSLCLRFGAVMCVWGWLPALGYAAPAAPLKAAAPSAESAALLHKLPKAYAKQGDFTTHFTQSYIDKLSGRRRDEAGQMWVKADGRVRFAYLQPERKDFVFDGHRAYFYEPDNAQVTVFEHFADSPIAGAMQFLWGQGEISKLFSAAPCPQATPAGSEVCPRAEAGEQVVLLVPRTPLPTVHHVALVVDVVRSRVARSVVYDPLDNQTRYSFEVAKTGVPIAASIFAFEIPSGVSVLRAPPMDKPASK